MEILLPFLAALLVGVGVFLVLSRTLIRLIVGLSMLTYGANLSIFIAGSGTELAAPPLLETLGAEGPYADPLPQALILTAIVIGFATTALLLVLAVRAYQATLTDDVERLLERSAADAETSPGSSPESSLETDVATEPR
ncbi:MAG: sodium:proton antiporter [Trueperaceae bacterium]|nr:sodium:proton antiporter [Trueperaceae bacterium]